MKFFVNEFMFSLVGCNNKRVGTRCLAPQGHLCSENIKINMTRPVARRLTAACDR